MKELTLSRPQPITFYPGILSLGLLTAGAHLYLAAQPDESLHFVFLLNGLGYLALLAAFVLPQFKKVHTIVNLAFIGYTFLTIILWFFFGSPSEGGAWDPFDVLVKVTELLLVIQLLLDFRQARSVQAEVQK
jgi:tellurite resistance protein TehA-like permease